jgi:hypothetical protein
MTGWIGVDLDGTLAEYTEWKGIDNIGAPIPVMVDRVKTWVEEGKDVRIFTARVWNAEPGTLVFQYINKWMETNLGFILPITATKDFGMIELYDDRCVQIETNTGRRIDGRE